jgi:hypothetical protein
MFIAMRVHTMFLSSVRSGIVFWRDGAGRHAAPGSELGHPGCRCTVSMSLPTELFRKESHPASARLHLG